MKRGVYILLFFLSLLGCSKTEKNQTNPVDLKNLVPSSYVFTAGEKIVLKFEISAEFKPHLVIENSYGTTLLDPNRSTDMLEFRLPPSYSRIAGSHQWQLIYDGKALRRGHLFVLPHLEEDLAMESYLGPRNITAGPEDYAMIVNIPTDKYDNPLPEDTSLAIEEYFQNTSLQHIDSISDLISWKKIISREQTGRIFVKSAIGNIQSDEMYINVVPREAEDFEIYSKRNHHFADGNQIVVFHTSIIRDQYGNTISDGTLITFHIETANGTSLFTTASTVNGMGTAKMVHPESEDYWRITAFVSGSAQSNTLDLEFYQAIQDFKVSLDEEQLRIIAGPIHSYMNQLIPDGTLVKFKVKNSSGGTENKTVATKNGIGLLDLGEFSYDMQILEVEITSMGITKILSLE